MKYRKYRIREKSLMWHLMRVKKPLQIIGMTIAFLLIFTAMSAAAADDLQVYEMQHGQAQVKEDVKTAEKVAENGDLTAETAVEEEWTSLGEFKITYYCKENYPHICNNGDASRTATGTTPTAGRTIAVDPSVIPYGTEVRIDGHTYVSEDCGGSIKDKRIDILVETHQEALNLGIKYAEVFVKGEES